MHLAHCYLIDVDFEQDKETHDYCEWKEPPDHNCASKSPLFNACVEYMTLQMKQHIPIIGKLQSGSFAMFPPFSYLDDVSSQCNNLVTSVDVTFAMNCIIQLYNYHLNDILQKHIIEECRILHPAIAVHMIRHELFVQLPLTVALQLIGVDDVQLKEEFLFEQCVKWCQHNEFMTNSLPTDLIIQGSKTKIDDKSELTQTENTLAPKPVLFYTHTLYMMYILHTKSLIDRREKNKMIGKMRVEVVAVFVFYAIHSTAPDEPSILSTKGNAIGRAFERAGDRAAVKKMSISSTSTSSPSVVSASASAFGSLSCLWKYELNDTPRLRMDDVSFDLCFPEFAHECLSKDGKKVIVLSSLNGGGAMDWRQSSALDRHFGDTRSRKSQSRRHRRRASNGSGGDYSFDDDVNQVMCVSAKNAWRKCNGVQSFAVRVIDVTCQEDNSICVGVISDAMIVEKEIRHFNCDALQYSYYLRLHWSDDNDGNANNYDPLASKGEQGLFGLDTANASAGTGAGASAGSGRDSFFRYPFGYVATANDPFGLYINPNNSVWTNPQNHSTPVDTMVGHSGNDEDEDEDEDDEEEENDDNDNDYDYDNHDNDDNAEIILLNDERDEQNPCHVKCGIYALEYGKTNKKHKLKRRVEMGDVIKVEVDCYEYSITFFVNDEVIGDKVQMLSNWTIYPAIHVCAERAVLKGVQNMYTPSTFECESKSTKSFSIFFSKANLHNHFKPKKKFALRNLFYIFCVVIAKKKSMDRYSFQF
ncbi:transcription factor with AP2 domain(s) [Reticulomyxa filosa]|uniref:Transcription factor with AP2 domain(S) n=1 Tax=Reticulomyxa filosa TaxID=46433 RepID=X6MEE9_RETFI|nr:transcription factor with AP2 domain(s) [Reticulomyxa filosa]|eukprot:ETO12289.1 transcription factor with AP2 domain(s) [Reticulomyxa filosa]